MENVLERAREIARAAHPKAAASCKDRNGAAAVAFAMPANMRAVTPVVILSPAEFAERNDAHWIMLLKTRWQTA
jgi:hypothetical protein